jgi:hypothetical protein
MEIDMRKISSSYYLAGCRAGFQQCGLHGCGPKSTFRRVGTILQPGHNCPNRQSPQQWETLTIHVNDDTVYRQTSNFTALSPGMFVNVTATTPVVDPGAQVNAPGRGEPK